MAKIALAGASGFVGRHLLNQLKKQHDVRALGRRATNEPKPSGVEWRQVDLFSARSTVEALKGVDVAIYLVHSMIPSSRLFQGDFHDTDLLLADNFAKACSINGVKQVIYLGGLLPEGYVSAHLQSRYEVEGVLKASGVPLTALRAGMIVGPGGSSFEILRALVSNLPMMLLPKWTQSSTQVVFIDDIVDLICECVLNPKFFDRTVNAVNGEFLTYESMLKKTARFLGVHRGMFSVPISSTGFSKLWITIFGNSTSELVSPLVDSLLCDLPQVKPDADVAPLMKFTSFEQMLAETFRREGERYKVTNRKRVLLQDSVRSIQRLPAISQESRWLALEYMNWLSKKFRGLLRVEIRESILEFRFFLFKSPLLILRYESEEFDLNRETFFIVGGLLSKTKDTGWLEFRQVDHRKFTLVSIHEFVPRLPWFIYIMTQAQIHRLVMASFGRHLQRKAAPPRP